MGFTEIKAVRRDPAHVIERYISGVAMRTIAEQVGIDRKSVKRILLENSVNLRPKSYSRDDPDPTGRIRLPEITPGEKVRFRHGNFRLLEVTECRSGRLWVFANIPAGWKESFTVFQLADELQEKGERK